MKVFIQVQIGTKLIEEKIIIQLHSESCPKTCENFKQFCLGYKDKYTYKGTPFHRIIPSFMIQGGDVVNKDGTGKLTIYDSETMEDENFLYKHEKPGVLSMANTGPNSNGCQFFITTIACPWLDNKHVVFGEVVDGMKTVKLLESMGSFDGKPSQHCGIYDCGICP